MTDWTETHRGAVPPWQCDVTEHFTVGFYFDRIEEASANFAELIGLAAAPAARQLDCRFDRELRAGASFHIESAVISATAGTLRLGHRVIDSATKETVTWFDDRWTLPLTDAQQRDLTARAATWGGPAAEERAEPTGDAGFIPTARGRVKPSDLDASGRFSLSAMVLRFSNASGQTGCAIGFDDAYMKAHRRGFSTFELILRVTGALTVDQPYVIETGIGHLGNSSMRMIHRLRDARTGQAVATLSQFGVTLDLDARRPARWPEEIRARAAAMVVPVG
jgi:acyl-CoA thioesterase FadM